MVFAAVVVVWVGVAVVIVVVWVVVAVVVVVWVVVDVVIVVVGVIDVLTTAHNTKTQNSQRTRTHNPIPRYHKTKIYHRNNMKLHNSNSFTHDTTNLCNFSPKEILKSYLQTQPHTKKPIHKKPFHQKTSKVDPTSSESSEVHSFEP